MTDWTARVLDRLDGRTGELISDLQAHVRTPSISGTDVENTAQWELAKQLEKNGFEVDHWRLNLPRLMAESDFPGVEVDRQEAWGLVGRLPGHGDGASLMLNAHIDVVPTGDASTWKDGDPFSGRIEHGAVHGRGACDMKGGLVAAGWAMWALATSGVRLRGDLLLGSVQGEEDGGLGTYAMLHRGWRADACVIPEPTSLDVVPANAGSLTFRLRVQGLATHASRRATGVSAIDKFFVVLAALERLETARNRTVHPLLQRWEPAYPLSIGMLQAGSWASSVPDMLTAEGRLGVALGEPVGEARSALENAVADVCAGDPWLCEHPVEVQWWGGQFASGQLPADSDLVERVARAHAVATGGTRAAQSVWGAPYGSDLRLMTELGGVPTLHYGPGDAGLAHGPDEAVPVEEVLICARTLAVLALQTCGVASE